MIQYYFYLINFCQLWLKIVFQSSGGFYVHMFPITLDPFSVTVHHHKDHDHVHDSAVSSVSIVSEGTLDLDYVRASLPALCCSAS